jgi:outer membrane protein OmpA-like peptidoglycan-associated protein
MSLGWIAGVAAWVALVALTIPQAAQAQTDSVQDMIQQLKGDGGSQRRRTRGLINRVVESDAPATANELRPSLSLLIQFDFDSATVRPESLRAIDNLTRAMRSPELADARFVIEGHTDARGRSDYNLRLSEMRAQRVKDILVHGGVSPTRLLSVGKGSTEPANPSDPGAAENRRVKVVNLD